MSSITNGVSLSSYADALALEYQLGDVQEVE